MLLRTGRVRGVGIPKLPGSRRGRHPSASSPPTLAVASSNAPATGEPSYMSPGSSSPSVSVDPGTTQSSTSSSTTASTSTTASADPPKVGSGPVPPKFDRSDFQSPSISELRAIGIGIKTFPGKLDLLVYCPLKNRTDHSELGRQVEVVLRHPLAKDHRWSGHEMRPMQKAPHDPRHELRGHPPFRGAGQEGVWHRQGQWKPHFPAALASIGFNCGPSGAIRRG